jgi:hypothetical protein
MKSSRFCVLNPHGIYSCQLILVHGSLPPTTISIFAAAGSDDHNGMEENL